jgi:hypothetical protein
MYSTKGRPRQVTDAQVQAILAWHRNRKTLLAFAKEIGLSTTTIQNIIKSNGAYKQPSPEKRELILGERRRRLQHLREDGWL